MRTIFFWLLLLTAAYAEHPASSRRVVQVKNWEYEFWAAGGNGEWALRCQYKAGDAEWQSTEQRGVGGTPEMRLPGTSVVYVVLPDMEIEEMWEYDVWKVVYVRD